MKVAAIQAAPVFLQREATTEKVLQLMREAARQGAKLCVFPETFLPGYPVWLMHLVSSLSEAQRQEAYARYLEAAVDPNGPEVLAIQDEAKRIGLFTYLGFVDKAKDYGDMSKIQNAFESCSMASLQMCSFTYSGYAHMCNGLMLMLLGVGITMGCLNAWHWVLREHRALREETEEDELE